MWLVTSYNNLNDFRQRKIDKRFDGTPIQDVTLGEPLMEAATATNRRIAFSYDFTQDQIDYITQLIASSPKRIRDTTVLVAELPTNWVYMELS